MAWSSAAAGRNCDEGARVACPRGRNRGYIPRMNLRAIVTTLPLCGVLLLLTLGGCHQEPAPDYPVPTDPPVAETDLAEFAELPEGSAAPEEAPAEDEE